MSGLTLNAEGSKSPVRETYEPRPLSVLQARLTRSRVLGAMGTVVVGAMASTVLRTQPALAHYSSPPFCCGPSGKCSCCSGTSCCSSGCRARDSGCGTNGSGWSCCTSSNPSKAYQCADKWDSDGHACICAGYLGYC